MMVKDSLSQTNYSSKAGSPINRSAKAVISRNFTTSRHTHSLNYLFYLFVVLFLFFTFYLFLFFSFLLLLFIFVFHIFTENSKTGITVLSAQRYQPLLLVGLNEYIYIYIYIIYIYFICLYIKRTIYKLRLLFTTFSIQLTLQKL